MDLAVQGTADTVNCPKCFTVVRRNSEFCPECGAALAQGEGSDVEVYNELAKANLARNRHHMQEAIDVALGILRKYPNNATAHTLLGDIYAELDDLKQAAEWYEMALDLNPDSASDRLKLDKVRDRMAQNEAASTARALGIPQSGGHIYTYAAAVLILMLIVGIAAFMMGRGNQPKTQGNGNSPGLIFTGPSVPGAKVDPGKGGDVALRVSDVQSDANTLSILQSNTKMGQRFLSSYEDPRDQGLTVTVQADGDESPETTAVGAASEVFTQMMSAKHLIIRVVRARKLEFVGNVSSDKLAESTRRTNNNASPEEVVKDAFTDVWYANGPSTPANTDTGTNGGTPNNTVPPPDTSGQGQPQQTFPTDSSQGSGDTSGGSGGTGSGGAGTPGTG